MNTFFPLFLVFIFIITCSREWDNILNTDEDLKNTPQILQINLDANRNISIILDYAYSDSSSIILERKSVGAFEKIPYLKLTQSTLVDTSFDKETNTTFVYRISVQKGNYRSSCSEEKQFIYTSPGLNEPGNLVAVSLELLGVRLQWKDHSNYEDGYRIEKDEGSGYQALTTVAANVDNYFDAISGVPATPLLLKYRIKAYNAELESDWVNLSTSYSGLGSPTNLRITNSSSANFTLAWEDNSSIETGYSIERSKDGAAYSVLAEVDANTTSYSYVIEEVGSYAHRIRTLKDGQYSSYSNEVSYQMNWLIPTDGLVAYYPFNGNANDESGNGNHGTVYGATLIDDRFGNIDNAYYFDGVDDLIRTYVLLDIINNFTISFWFMPKNTHEIDVESNTSMTGLIGQKYVIAPQYYENNHSGSGLSAGINGVSVYEHADKYLPPLLVYEAEIIDWMHVAIIYNNKQPNLYINNQYIKSGLKSAKEVHPSINIFGAGSHENQICDFFKGSLDEIYVFDRIITSDEIHALYHQGGWDE